MLRLEIPTLSVISILIVTFLFSLKDDSAKDVRLRFLFVPLIAMILYSVFMSM